MEANPIDINLFRGGEYFIYSLWIQSQMTDLIILAEHPKIIKRFVAFDKKIPPPLVRGRMKYWQEDFGYIKKRFLKVFENKLSKQAMADLEIIYHIRNAIGHSYVSLARNYFLYRPGSAKKYREFKKAFNINTSNSKHAKPIVIKFNFSDDKIYLHNFGAIQRTDEQHLKKLANELNIPHPRIR